MVRKYTEDEIIQFLWIKQKGRCAWCNEPLDSNGRSVGIARGNDRAGKWQLHHNPPKSKRQQAFGEKWDQLIPEIPLNMRLICLKCHDFPHGGYHKTRPRDILR